MSTVYDVAVVGSRGFLGSAIVAALERAEASVAGFTLESPLVADGALTASPRVVVWAAGRMTPADTSHAEQVLADVAQFIDAARRSGEPPHVVLLSSGGAIYGPPGVAPFSEDDEPGPANEYGRIKLAEERLFVDSGLDCTIVRVANPYGPGQRGEGQGVIGAWLRAARGGHAVTLFGDGSVIRDYVYIDDVADAVVAVTERLPGGVINLGSGVGTSLAALLDIVGAAVAPTPLEVLREPARGIDPAANWLDVGRARELLGWSATTPLAEGISRTWATVA